MLIFTYFRKVSSNKTELKNVLHIDLKGSVGSMIYNKFAAAQYDAFKKLNDELCKS